MSSLLFSLAKLPVPFSNFKIVMRNMGKAKASWCVFELVLSRLMRSLARWVVVIW